MPHVACTGMDEAKMSPSAIEYWSRPFMVRLNTSHTSCTSMFHTYEAAVDYVQKQAAFVEARIQEAKAINDPTWIAMDVSRTRIIDPLGSFITAGELLKKDRIESH